VKLNLIKKKSVGAVCVAYTQQLANNSEIKYDKTKFCLGSLGCIHTTVS